MGVFNGVSENLLTSRSAFASTLVNTGIVSHTTPVLAAVSSDEDDTHQYFAAVAQGDIIHFIGVYGAVSSSATLDISFRNIGTTTEVDLIDFGTTAATSFNTARALNFAAPADGLIFAEFSRYHRTSSTAGVSITALISKPF